MTVAELIADLQRQDPMDTVLVPSNLRGHMVDVTEAVRAAVRVDRDGRMVAYPGHLWPGQIKMAVIVRGAPDGL